MSFVSVSSCAAGACSVAVFSFSLADQELVTDPLPFVLPLVGTLVESGETLELGFISDFDFDQPIPAIEEPIENVPLPIPTILPPGGTANLLLSATSSEGTTSGQWSSSVVAVGEPSGCAGNPDIDGNGSVNGADLAALLSSWNQNGGPGDINCDGIVNGADLSELLASWSICVTREAGSGPDCHRRERQRFVSCPTAT